MSITKSVKLRAFRHAEDKWKAAEEEKKRLEEEEKRKAELENPPPADWPHFKSPFTIYNSWLSFKLYQRAHDYGRGDHLELCGVDYE